MKSKLFEEIYDPYDDDLGYGPDGLGVYDGEMTDVSGEMDERDELIPDEDHAKVGLKPVSRKNDDGTMSGFDKFEDEAGWIHYRNRRDMGFVDGGSAAYDDGSLMGQDMWDEPLEKDPEADDIEMQNFYQPRRAFASSQLDNEPYRDLGYIDKDNPIEEVDYDPFEEGKKQLFNDILNEGHDPLGIAASIKANSTMEDQIKSERDALAYEVGDRVYDDFRFKDELVSPDRIGTIVKVEMDRLPSRKGQQSGWYDVQWDDGGWSHRNGPSLKPAEGTDRPTMRDKYYKD